jgi:hypothetical protein
VHDLIQQLVAAQLQPLHDNSAVAESELSVATFQHAQPLSAELVAFSGAGLDHYGGELMLAAALLHNTPRGYQHRLLWGVSSQRTRIGGWSSTKGGFNDRHTSVAHHELVRVEVKDGMLDSYVKLHTPRGEELLRFGKATAMIGRFYQALMQQPAPQRMVPPRPFPQPSAEDPAGAQAASQGFWREDPDALALLVGIDERVRSGFIDAGVGYDLSCRILLAHRSAFAGPGIASGPGQWLSPMSLDDLGHTLVGIFGPPTQQNVDGQGWTWLSFALDPQRDALSPALSALGIAAYISLGVGFSPGKVIAHQMLQREPLTAIHVGMHSGSASSVYTLRTPRGPLEQVDAMMSHQLHQALIHSAMPVLGRRCSLGWGPSYAELWG